MGLFKILGKISEWVPSRKEYRRNKIEDLERKIDELQKQDSTPVTRKLYVKYANKLSELKKQAKNS